MNQSHWKTPETFYCINKIPDITTFTANQANEFAGKFKPIVAVWNFGKGNINVIQNPANLYLPQMVLVCLHKSER